MFFFFMIRRPPRSTRTEPLFPYTTPFRSPRARAGPATGSGDELMSVPGKLPEQKRPFQDIRLSAYELSVALRREFKGHLIHQPDKVLNGAVHACFDDPCRNPDSATCFLDCISGMGRSEEHTSELQSLMRISYAVFCLKKKKQYSNNKNRHTHT